MKQFSLEEYLKDPSQKVVTRDGRRVRIICTDVNDERFPIIALVMEEDEEICYSFTKEGFFFTHLEYKSRLDLFFADKEPSYRPYKTIEEVLDAIKEHGHYVKDGNTIRILEKFTDMGEIAYHFSGWTSSTVRTWEYVHDKVMWADGAPFGVKEE